MSLPELRSGEDAQMMVCPATEGEDRPLKHPLTFMTCELAIMNTVDHGQTTPARAHLAVLTGCFRAVTWAARGLHDTW